MAESLSGYNQLEGDTSLQFNFFSTPSGKISQNSGRASFLLPGTMLTILLSIVPNCRSQSVCNAWDKFYPTDLEFKETLSNSTLRGAGCYSNPLPSRTTDLELLDGVDPYSDMSMEVECSLDSSTLQDEAIRGRRYIRMLDISRNQEVAVLARFIRLENRCGIIVRPRKPLKYETFYATYLMRGPATDNFKEPASFRTLKWKAFRNNIDTETDELYRDALTRASERWGTHPDSFRMIQAFTTRSFRSIAIPSITGRNNYFAMARTPALLDSLDQSKHPLVNFMVDAHPDILSEEVEHSDLSDDTELNETERETQRLILVRRNIQTLSSNTGLRSGFAEISGACTTLPEPELCDYQEVEFPDLHLRYIPFLYEPNIRSFQKVVIMPLEAFQPGQIVPDILRWKKNLASRKIALIVYLGPPPANRASEPDHLLKELIQGALSFSALPVTSGSEIALYCNETDYCPMLGLLSKNVTVLVGPNSFQADPGSLRQSFPPVDYRKDQLRAGVLAPFRFRSFLLEMDRTLIALKKDQFHIRKSDPERWFQSDSGND